MPLEQDDLIALVDAVRFQQEQVLNLSVQMEALLAALKRSSPTVYSEYTSQVKTLEKRIEQRSEFAALKQLTDIAARLRGR